MDRPYPRFLDWSVLDDEEHEHYGRLLWPESAFCAWTLTRILLGIQSIAPDADDRYPLLD